MGIEKILPRWRDLEVMLQLLPRSSTGERMNPYTSLWIGRAPTATARGVPPRPARRRAHRRAGRRGRARRAALHPLLGVPERVPGLRAHRRPRLRERLSRGRSARSSRRSCRASRTRRRCRGLSSLCGACYEVCPVKIDIPSILVHLRGRVVREVGAPLPERAAMAAMARVFASRRALRGARSAPPQLGRGPLARRRRSRPWTRSRELPEVPAQTFRDWWRDVSTARDDDPGARARRAARRAGRRAAARRRSAYEPAPPPAAATPSRASPSASPTTARRCATADDARRDDRAACAREHERAPARRPGRPAGGGAPTALELVEDHGLSARELDALDGALTGCALAIAETGTIVLDGGERSGRRALTLVPDLHVCVVERDQVVATVPEAIRALDGRRAAPFTFVSGPQRHERHRARPRRGRPRPAAPGGAARLARARAR